MQKNSTTMSSIHTPITYPASNKRYLQGNREDLRVPYREIALSPTRHGDRLEENPPLAVYDTSGPYTDPCVGIDLTRGLPPLRAAWIEDRQDTKAGVAIRARRDESAMISGYPEVMP
jgi:phosphomethylpyrimidine synthase